MGAPEIISAVRTSADTLEVEFTPLLNIENDITSYTVIYTPTVNASCSKVFAGHTFIVSTDMTTVEIDKLEPNRDYCVAVAAQSESGLGNYSQVLLVNGELSTVQSSCLNS